MSEFPGAAQTIVLLSAPDDDKSAYDHAFVLLSASAAKSAGIDRADTLLNAISETIMTRFWDASSQTFLDTCSGSFDAVGSYRGANSTMHMTEASLAAGFATGDPAWFNRARRLIEHIILDKAANHDWRVPEHYHPDWRVDPHFNEDNPFDCFKPPGFTPGHGVEWARLCLHAAADFDNDPALINAAQ